MRRAHSESERTRAQHRSRLGVALAIAFFASCAVASGAAARPGIERSIVRILNYSQRANWYSPWDTLGSTQGAGSGFVVGGGLIMTNAHVVSDSRLLIVYLHGDPTPHRAEVRYIAHDCDLALLVPLEPEILDSVPALALGGLPRLGSAVETFGYPAGGLQIASTRGIVSRIQFELYTHSGIDRHIAVQTDAAINPGNSGGPVLQDGAVVGVAFQAAPDLENVGFFIPTEVVRHFLEDVKDGAYDGYPELGVSHSTMESPAARAKAGLRSGESGVIVDFVFPGSSGDGYIEPGDVMLEVDGSPVADDGTVDRGGLRLDLGALLDAHQVNETIRVDVLRAGQRRVVSIPASPYRSFQRYANLYDQLPPYYIYAGLVFVPLGRETLETFGADWSSKAEKHLLYEYFHRIFEEPELLERERVVLLRRLDHPVNANGAWSRNLILDRVNGREIWSLAGVTEAIEANEGPYHVFEFAYYGRFMVLDRAAADAAHPEILERYGVPRDRRP